ncbi:Peroxisomal membrane anchor protein (Pex14p) conserved region [Musa troglodytarum]|uniref:Peroxisomal membrane protein PEX14 n=1 Tax=Musa troglodytarum TaxID=320322 RepID=A0A9E7LCY9_9LILI|nr:Peroxisomal membrane anchor protein (Pex14p) conserved region [Musa troglodytarum]
MANQSPSPSPPSIEGSPTPGSETEKLTGGDGSDAKMDAANEFLGKPLLREDQVQNAVKFLSHPKVRSSPVVHRRSFLEKKGLTKEEIDEAFHRVPDPPSNAATGEAYTTGPGNISCYAAEIIYHHAAPRSGTNSSTSSCSCQLSFQPSSCQSFIGLMHFLQQGCLLLQGLVLLFFSSFSSCISILQKMVVPRLKAWIRKVVEEESESGEDKLDSKLAEEAAEAAKTAAAAAAAVAKASQELLSTKSEERKYFEAFMGALDVQVKEMKSMGDAIRRLESRRDEDKLIQENIHSTNGNGSVNNAWRTSQQVKFGGTSNTNFGDVRSQSSPAFMDSLYVPNPNSYTEPWQAAQHSQQRPSYSQQSHTSDERLGSKTEESYGPSSGMTGNHSDTPELWWSKKSTKITEIETEGEERKQFDERPQQRGWVPPQPPAVVLPEAADAIRRPKPPVQKQQSGDEQSVASSDVGKEMEMRTDSVAVAENSGSMAFSTSQIEIQEEKSAGVEIS